MITVGGSVSTALHRGQQRVCAGGAAQVFRASCAARVEVVARAADLLLASEVVAAGAVQTGVGVARRAQSVKARAQQRFAEQADSMR